MRKTVFNFRILPLFAGVMIWGMATVVFLIEALHILSLIFSLIFLFISVLALIYHPICFVFDAEKLKIQYLFGFHLIIYWKNVKSIRKKPVSSKWFEYDYDISTRGKATGKRSFFTHSEINATKTTKRLIRQYWRSDFNE